MASPPETQIPAVENPSVEYLLKAAYSTYKREVKSLSDKLAQANEKLLNKTPCSFCATLNRKVEDLRNQVEQLLQAKQKQQQARPTLTKDASAQTDSPAISVPSSGSSSKRIIIYSSPRKRLRSSGNSTQSPAKNCKSEAYNSDEEVVLAPNTPERDPQRESRVKRWLQTMEIPETVDPDMLQGRALDSHCSVSEGINAECQKGVGDTETEDLDATMLPQNWVNQKRELCKSDKQTKDDELDRSSATSEDLLQGAVLQDNKDKGKSKVLSDVGNKTIEKRNVTSLKQSVLPFKYKSEPVRKKKERMQLPAHQCADCAKYYQNDDNGQQYRNICSRHRAIYEAPATPEHFWELDFPDTQECKERGYLDTTQFVKVPSRRKRPFLQQ